MQCPLSHLPYLHTLMPLSALQARGQHLESCSPSAHWLVCPLPQGSPEGPLRWAACVNWGPPISSNCVLCYQYQLFFFFLTPGRVWEAGGQGELRSLSLRAFLKDHYPHSWPSFVGRRQSQEWESKIQRARGPGEREQSAWKDGLGCGVGWWWRGLGESCKGC